MNFLSMINEIKLASKKEQSFFIGLAVFYVGMFLFLIVLIVSLFSKSIILNAEINEPFKEFKSYTEGLRNYPSAERESYLLKEDEGLQKLFSSLKQYPLFYDDLVLQDNGNLSALKFKEKLFRIKSSLRKKARKADTFLINDIGFKEWEDKLPPSFKLPELLQALDIVEFVLGVAIQAKVAKIDNVYFSEIKERALSKKNNKHKYHFRELHFEFRGDGEAILKFLKNVWESDKLLLIKMFQVNKVVIENDVFETEKRKELFKVICEIEQVML